MLDDSRGSLSKEVDFVDVTKEVTEELFVRLILVLFSIVEEDIVVMEVER